MSTFITGATSSIGRVLVKELAAAGEPVRILARRSSNRSGLELPGVEFVYGDVTDSEAVRRGMDGCERVCHLAAIVGQNTAEAEWWRVNRDGSRNVLQAAYDLGVKSLVQVSSLSVLGTTQMGEVADETHLPDPATYFNLYQKTKRAGDDYLLGGPCLTFPEIWDVVAKVLGKPPVRRRVPNGVLKTVAAVSRALTGKSFLPPEFFELIDYDWNFSTAKAQRELGWTMTPFAEGMAATWAEYQAAGWKS